jgi:hypothetical protein
MSRVVDVTTGSAAIARISTTRTSTGFQAISQPSRPCEIGNPRSCSSS